MDQDEEQLLSWLRVYAVRRPDLPIGHVFKHLKEHPYLAQGQLYTEPSPYPDFKNWNNLEQAEWIISQPEIIDLLDRGFKITAIKMVREMTYIGLAEAKDILEFAHHLYQTGHTSAFIRERINKQADEAIRSIEESAVRQRGTK